MIFNVNVAKRHLITLPLGGRVMRDGTGAAAYPLRVQAGIQLIEKFRRSEPT